MGNDNTVKWLRLSLQLPPSRLRPHFVRADVRVHEYPDGALAVYWGPHRLGDYDAAGALVVLPPVVARAGGSFVTWQLRVGLAADHALGQTAAPHKLPRTRPLSRRWHDTVAGLFSLRAEYARWLDASPEATRDTATRDALQAMVDLDLEDIIAIQPPRAFGGD